MPPFLRQFALHPASMAAALRIVDLPTSPCRDVVMRSFPLLPHYPQP